MVVIFPLDENDLPDQREFVIVSAIFGASVSIWANWILKRNFYRSIAQTVSAFHVAVQSPSGPSLEAF